MVVTIISEKGEIIFQEDTKTVTFEREKFEQFLQEKIAKVELIMQDSITIAAYSASLRSRKGHGVVKEQKFFLK